MDGALQTIFLKQTLIEMLTNHDNVICSSLKDVTFPGNLEDA